MAKPRDLPPEATYRTYMKEMVSGEGGLTVPPVAHVLHGPKGTWVEVWHLVTDDQIEEWENTRSKRINNLREGKGP